MTNQRGSAASRLGEAVLHQPALRMSGISKTFAQRTVLQPFELAIAPGEMLALLGQNGSGKSTLIKVLSGYHHPDQGGHCWVGGQPLEFGNPQASHKAGLRFVHQDLGLVATSTVLDNLAFTRGYNTRALTISTRSERTRAEASLGAVGLDLDPNLPVSKLTPAQRTGVAVARALDMGGAAAVALVLDEPTATLPTEEVDHLHAMLRSAASKGIAILYVTHHLDEVFRLADRVCVLRDGYLVESCSVQDIDRETIVQRLVGSEVDAVRRLYRDTSGGRGAGTLFEVQGLQTDFIHDVSLTAHSGEVVGVYGLTGSGRESFLGSVFGSLPRESGVVKVNGQEIESDSPRAAIAAGLGYLPPDRKVTGGVMHMTATENLTMASLRQFWRRGWLHNRAEDDEARTWFQKLQVSPIDGIGNFLSSFSGGNQQKIVLGKWLRLIPKVILLDEPTQGVDVGAKAELHRQILSACRNGAVVVVSSTDVEELASLCDRVMIMRHGKVAAQLAGDMVNETEINRSFQGVS